MTQRLITLTPQVTAAQLKQMLLDEFVKSKLKVSDIQIKWLARRIGPMLSITITLTEQLSDKGCLAEYTLVNDILFKVGVGRADLMSGPDVTILHSY